MTLTDWLRSDWLETFTTYPAFLNAFNAYRLASIGLVGNVYGLPPRIPATHFAYRLASIGLVGNLPYPLRLPSSARRKLTDWLRSDWLETNQKPDHCWSYRQAYRLASIGLVGNFLTSFAILVAIDDAYRLASIGLVGNYRVTRILEGRHCLPIGFDRIGWKHTRFDHILHLAQGAYRLASIGLVGNFRMILLVRSGPWLTDWLRSDWLETSFS